MPTKLYKTNKVVLRVKDNAAEFLNGITSNALDQPRNAFLNMHGRIIATFDQVKIDEDEFWIVLEQPFVEILLQHVDRFCRLSHTAVEKTPYSVYFDLQGDAVMNSGEWSIPQKRGRLILADQEHPANVSEEEFTLFRLQNVLPLHGVDYQDEFILNVSEEEFTSFTKGCFLGQEPVSKVHHRSRPRWKLVVRYEDDCSEEEKCKMTSRGKDPLSGRVLGFVFAGNE